MLPNLLDPDRSRAVSAIEVGSVWRRKSSGQIVTVESVEYNYLTYRGIRRVRILIGDFLRKHEPVEAPQ